MQLPMQLRDRLTADDVPQPVYALVGISILLRERLEALPGQARETAQSARRTRDRWVTTALQIGHERRDRATALPDDLMAEARIRWAQALGVPGALRGDVEERVIDLREAATGQYLDLTASGERALMHWHAERILNQRADRVTRSVTPAAARATISARDAARRAAASPTAAKVAQSSRRARASAKHAWQEYLAAVDEAGAQRWGDAASGCSAAGPRVGSSAVE